MTRTLADLRANPQKSYSERSHTICSVPHVVAEVQSLVEELQNLPEPDAPAPAPVDADDREGRPLRQGEGATEPAPNPREAEILARLAELNDIMAANSDEFRLRDKWSDGEWRRWVDEHPPRVEGKPGHDRDKRIGQGELYCNTDALIDTIGSFVVSWNGDPLAEGDWDTLFNDTVPLPEKAAMATAVLSMYENRLDFSGWRSALSSNLKRLRAFASPSDSGSVRDDSTAGSPPSSISTSTQPGTQPA